MSDVPQFFRINDSCRNLRGKLLLGERVRSRFWVALLGVVVFGHCIPLVNGCRPGLRLKPR